MNSLKNVSFIWYDLCDFVRRNKVKILILLGIFGLGALIGFWYGISIDDAYGYMNESPNIYIQINLENKSGFGFFISSFFIALIATALIFVFSLHPILSYLGALVPLYFGYCLGFEITIMFRVCGISALLLALFGILILRVGLGVIFVLLVASVIDSTSCFSPKQDILKICLMYFIISIIFIFVISIFLPFFCKMLVYI